MWLGYLERKGKKLKWASRKKTELSDEIVLNGDRSFKDQQVCFKVDNSRSHTERKYIGAKEGLEKFCG